MKVRFLPVLIVLFVGSHLYAVGPLVGDVITAEQLFPNLDAVLKKSVEQSPRMLNRALDLEIAENNRIQARANILPILSGSYRFYQAQDDRHDGLGRQDVSKVAYDLTLTQPLYHWGERMNNYKIGEIQARISKGQYRDGYRLFAQEVRSFYQQLIIQKLTKKRAAFYLQYTQAILRQAEDRLAKKVISEGDIFPVRLAEEQAQIAFEKIELDFENAKQSFMRLTGTVGLTDAQIPDEIPALKSSPNVLSSMLAGYLGKTELPTLEAYNARQEMTIEGLKYDSTRTRLRPKFNAVLGTNQDEQSYTANIAQKYQVSSIFAGITVSWNIFDGFATGAAIRNGLHRKHQLESDYKELTARLTQDAQIQLKQIGFAVRNMSIYDRFLASSVGTLKTKQDDFKRGVSAEAEVDLAQIALYDTQINAFNARSGYLSQVGEFLGLVMEDPVLANLSR